MRGPIVTGVAFDIRSVVGDGHFRHRVLNTSHTSPRPRATIRTASEAPEDEGAMGDRLSREGRRRPLEGRRGRQGAGLGLVRER